MDGILLIDKPAGWTSFDVVAKVRSVLRTVNSRQSIVNSQSGQSTNDNRLTTPSQKVKVGHTGTLDPAATGLLILVIGKYTKRAGEFSKLDKTYEAEITLGATSTTGDSEGELSTIDYGLSTAREPTASELKAVLEQFKGQISQTPPIHSAIKVNGQRAYKLAREGKEVKLEPREVTVYRLEVTAYQYPILKVTADVSSGTYIRSLAEDIGSKLGTGAYLSALRRTSVGKFQVKDALNLDKLDFNAISDHLATDVAK